LAVQAANAACPGWAATAPSVRAAIMHRIADLAEHNVDTLANMETLDNGGLLRSNLRGVMPRVAHYFRFFADWLVEHLDTADFETHGHSNHVSWDPPASRPSSPPATLR